MSRNSPPKFPGNGVAVRCRCPYNTAVSSGYPRRMLWHPASKNSASTARIPVRPQHDEPSQDTPSFRMPTPRSSSMTTDSTIKPLLPESSTSESTTVEVTLNDLRDKLLTIPDYQRDSDQ